VSRGDITIDRARSAVPITALAPAAKDPSEPRPRKRGVRRDLQGIRGLGIIFVVIGHLWRWPPGVYAMLDMFFVLSGFLITGVLIDSIKKYGGISFTQFYLSRVRRLMPMAVMVVLVTTAAFYLLYSAALGESVAKDGFWALIFGINWHFAATSTNYFSDQASSPLLHYWSLSVEEQFYLVWPAVVLVAMLVAHRVKLRSQTALVVVLGVITVASFAYSMWHSVASPGTAYFSTFDRVWEFGVGGLIAVGRPYWERMPDWLGLGMSWVATIGLVVALFLLTYGRPFPAPWGLPVVLLTGAVMAGGVGRSTRRLWHLDNPPMVYLGDISYSLYLWHLPVNVLLLGFIAHGSPWYYVTAIVLSLALAVASYHFVERPLRYAPVLMTAREREHFAAQKRKGIRRGFAIVGTASTASLALVVVLSGAFTSAVPASASSQQAATQSLITPKISLTSQQRRLVTALGSTQFPKFALPLSDLGIDGWVRDISQSTCFPLTGKQAETCYQHSPRPQRLALVVGDSFAAAWSPAVRTALGPSGWGVQVMAQGECPSWTLPSYVDDTGRPAPTCAELHKLVLRTVRERHPGLVVLSSASAEAENSTRKDIATTPFAVAHDGLSRTIRDLRSAGAQRVVVLGPPPQLKDLRDCVTRFGSPSACISNPDEQFQDDVKGESQAAEELGVQYIDTENWFCFEGACPAFVGRTPVTADGGHLTVQYARSLGPLLRAALLKP
jgi:peptidoglycan/LPS O-acetylase OafA/YrhL